MVISGEQEFGSDKHIKWTTKKKIDLVWLRKSYYNTSLVTSVSTKLLNQGVVNNSCKGELTKFSLIQIRKELPW